LLQNQTLVTRRRSAFTPFSSPTGCTTKARRFLTNSLFPIVFTFGDMFSTKEGSDHAKRLAALRTDLEDGLVHFLIYMPSVRKFFFGGSSARCTARRFQRLGSCSLSRQSAASVNSKLRLRQKVKSRARRPRVKRKCCSRSAASGLPRKARRRTRLHRLVPEKGLNFSTGRSLAHRRARRR
jgi:hypothetical protein